MRFGRDLVGGNLVVVAEVSNRPIERGPTRDADNTATAEGVRSGASAGFGRASTAAVCGNFSEANATDGDGNTAQVTGTGGPQSPGPGTASP